ncbi:unnamed protein product [Hymenolepis diminuta]|uniref:Secreted protein n=1 Tax=Hymenolepis diminuta TaxID=6216 RepID=A0A0R3SCY5_HYMDI|nr:unnamed protein product [Hymenolepis diminuta]VUZ43099.1 unnamed protein product [Hymenolepis diminuta]
MCSNNDVAAAAVSARCCLFTCRPPTRSATQRTTSPPLPSSILTSFLPCRCRRSSFIYPSSCKSGDASLPHTSRVSVPSEHARVVSCFASILSLSHAWWSGDGGGRI